MEIHNELWDGSTHVKVLSTWYGIHVLSIYNVLFSIYKNIGIFTYMYTYINKQNAANQARRPGANTNDKSSVRPGGPTCNGGSGGVFETGPPRKYQTSENLRMVRKGGQKYMKQHVM